MSSDQDARPYGRRAFLVLLAGGLTSFAWAAKVSGVLSPFTSAFSQALGNLFPVGGWRIYTISGSMPIFDPKEYRLEIGGLVRKPQSFTYEQLLALPRAHQVSTFHCVTGWTVHDVRWSGVRLEHAARPRRAAPRRQGASLRLARAALQRLADDGAGRAPRRDARARDGRAAALPPARLAGARRDPRDVRLQGRQVARRRSSSSTTSRPATGKGSATTRTRGSAARMATASRPAAHPSLGPHRARRSLDPRDGVLRAARNGAVSLPAEPRRGRRPPPAPEDDPHLHGDRLGGRAHPRARGRRPARAPAHGARGRHLRRRRPRLAPRPARAAGPAERRPEAEHDRDRGLRDPVRDQRLLPLVRRARHALPARERAARARLPDVRVADPLPRAPCVRRDPSEHAALAERDHARLGARGLGRQAPREMGATPSRKRSASPGNGIESQAAGRCTRSSSSRSVCPSRGAARSSSW